MDTVYELMCCFALLSGLNGRISNLRVVETGGENGFRFAMKPGAKSSFAFFRFEYGGVSYDVCCGTEIPPGGGEPPEAPDVSLQKHDKIMADTVHKCGQPVGLWDAKFHDGSSSKADVQQMSWWCDIFQIPKCAAGDVLERCLPPMFQVSAVVTNSPNKKFNKTQLLNRRFSVVFSFLGDTNNCAPEPSRAQHIAAP